MFTCSMINNITRLWLSPIYVLNNYIVSFTLSFFSWMISHAMSLISRIFLLFSLLCAREKNKTPYLIKSNCRGRRPFAENHQSSTERKNNSEVVSECLLVKGRYVWWEADRWRRCVVLTVRARSVGLYAEVQVAAQRNECRRSSFSKNLYVVFLVYVSSKPMFLRDSSRAYADALVSILFSHSLSYCSVQFLFWWIFPFPSFYRLIYASLEMVLQATRVVW